MSLPKPVGRFSPQEYYDLEYAAAYKSDYYQGEMYAMWAGGTRNHSRICSNISREVGNRLEGTNCVDFQSDLRVMVKATGLRTYPDASVFRGPMEADSEDAEGQTYTNPIALFEVLSKGTEAYDCGFKCEHYRRIESLNTIVLLWQKEPHARLHERQQDGSWSAREVSGLDSVLPIASLAIEIPLSKLYDQVDFNAME
jgi:Uma2 family endonuclease